MPDPIRGCVVPRRASPRRIGLPALVVLAGAIGVAVLVYPHAQPATGASGHRPRFGIGAALMASQPPPSTAPVSSGPPVPSEPTSSSSAVATSPSSSGPAEPVIGMLAPSADQMNQLSGTVFRRVMLPVGWDSVEPRPGYFNPYALTDLSDRVAAARSAGFDVVLDPGLQYPPAWVFDLPGQTRFVNQYGDVWHGTLSTDVPNAVFDDAVRQAEGEYLARLGATVAGQVVAVRVGGLLSGELRLPPPVADGHSMSLWDYDPAARAAAPAPGWRPGSGTADDARRSLDYYFQSLTDYLSWQLTTMARVFPDTDLQVMFPGWGLRPGAVAAALADGLAGHTNAEVNGMISMGLDWDRQLDAVADAAAAGVPVTVYCTWADADEQSNSPQGVAPLRYLAQLAAARSLPVAGENTGGGGLAAFDFAVAQARALHLTSLMFMSGQLIDSGAAGVDLPDLVAGVTRDLAG